MTKVVVNNLKCTLMQVNSDYKYWTKGVIKILKLMVLKDNPRLGINNETYTLKQIKDKLKEEYEELIDEIDKEDLIKTAEESLDNIQVNILLLDYLRKRGIDIGQVSKRHNKKLVNRGWREKAILLIRIIAKK